MTTRACIFNRLARPQGPQSLLLHRTRSRIGPVGMRCLAAIALSLLVACVTYMPVDEWTLARSAFESAKEADAARYVPSIWFNAEQTYREAQKSYRDRRYVDAKKQFIQAKNLCEQAENAARLARQQSGEVIP